MITIIFESHATSVDNEARLSSGWNDVDLSELGLRQAAELGARYRERLPDAVFCSDLQRSYKTVVLAFKDSGVPVIVDSRLRECDYGRLTGASTDKVEGQKGHRIDTAFPDGESYEDTSRRMAEFLDDLKVSHAGKTIMVVGHRATQYGLEEHCEGKKLVDVVLAPWKWRPGWEYEINGK